ncbi:MAG: HNH endonuclease, partial [Gemmataceae bacterium]|nr:HNH endonuclease [Gemmataceae bacterium]
AKIGVKIQPKRRPTSSQNQHGPRPAQPFPPSPALPRSVASQELGAQSGLAAFSKVVGRDVFHATAKTNADRHGVVLTFRANADHVIPWSLGGRTDLQNLVAACWCCNYGKSNFTLVQLGLDDPQERPATNIDTWDGLTSLLSDLRANAT